MLVGLSKRLHAAQTFKQVIETVLDDTISLLGAEYGNVQLPVDDELVIVAQRGLTEPFLKTFMRVKKSDGCACGQALRRRKTVVIRDVKKDPQFGAFVKDAAKAGFQAVQSTPLFTADGLLLGMVSTQFANVHEPTQIELNALQVYSVIAAEHAYQLLEATPLAEKAKEMNRILYDSMSPAK